MSARKIFAALILVLYASCSFAEITPKQVLSDPRFYPLVETTKKHGRENLPGRYVVTMELPSRTGGPLILAPTQMIIEIEQPESRVQVYTFHYDIHGGKKAEGYMILDTKAEAPVLSSFTKTESGDYELSGMSYAGLSLAENDKSWLTGAVSDGSINILIPISNIYFPEGWYLGAWKCADGTQFTFDGDKMYSNGQEIGTFTAEDNRITVTASDGSKDTVYAIWNPYKEILVMTFSSGPNGMGTNAGVFTRMNDSEKPETNRQPRIESRKTESIAQNPTPKNEPLTQSPIHQNETVSHKTESTAQNLPLKNEPSTQGPIHQNETESLKTEPTPAPKMPTEFPPMPKVNMPPQNLENLDITGVWGAYVNGQQWIIQYQGNNYYGWINGQPSEMGIFTVKGKTITGSNNHGVTFTAELELDDDGDELDMTFENGSTIHYQKLQ